MKWIVFAVLPVACSFSGAAAPDNVDADSDGGAGDASESRCGDWGDRALFDCAAPEFDPSNSNGAAAIAGDWEYHTGLDTFTELATSENSSLPENLATFTLEVHGLEVRVWLVDELVIAQGSRLIAIGELPLLIAVNGPAQIDGRINVSSRYFYDVDNRGPRFSLGAGSSGAGCPDPDDSDAGLAGKTSDNSRGDGGGGAGYGAVGGNGGHGGNNADETAGGTPISLSNPLQLRGGCRGGRGGDGARGTPGRGGHGGGALGISAVGTVALGANGSLCASGAAGYGQTSSRRNGGGGGGSGGLLVLESASLDLRNGSVGVNGGSGGGGADNVVVNEVGSVLSGRNGRCFEMPIDGAAGDGARGGDGGARGVDATSGGDSGNGAAGGGGGVGHFVVVTAADSVVDVDNTSLSPPPRLVDVNLDPLP